MKLQWPIEYVYEPQTEWDVHTEWRWRGWRKPKEPTLVERVDFGNGVEGYVYEIPCIVPMWPSFWRQPRRHIRMKRAAKRYDRLMRSPIGEQIARLEHEAFVEGKLP